MTGEGLKRIESSLSRIAKLSNVVSVVIAMLLAISIVVGFASIIGFAIIGSDDSGAAKGWLDRLSDIAPLLLLWIITSASLLVVFCIFREMAHGGSPFTAKHAKRLRLLGIVSLVGVLVETIVSPEARMVMSVGILDIGTHPSSFTELPAIPINAQSFIFGVMTLCFSFAFEYGALLQKLSDETV